MDAKYKVCANCCHVTKAADQFYCMDPEKLRSAQNAVPLKVAAGDRQSCFQETGLMPESSLAVH